MEFENLNEITVPKFTFEHHVTMAKCVKVYDGDTVQLIFSHPLLSGYSRFSCRLYGYNSAELKTKDIIEKEMGLASKKFLENLVLNKIVRAEFKKMDKYGRPLVVLYLDDVNINEYVIETGYGKPYDGTGRKDWAKI
jgi:endonuclease YncB( thermonuclease family)